MRDQRGGPSSPAGGRIFLVVAVFFVGMSVVVAVKSASGQDEPVVIAPGEPVSMSGLRAFDSNFSEIVFTDFCYSLFARFYSGEDVTPYVAVRAPSERCTQIVIGGFTIVDFSGLDGAAVWVTVEFEANYTSAGKRWYVRERWRFERARDILSPAPETAHAEHCPSCGAALQRATTARAHPATRT